MRNEAMKRPELLKTKEKKTEKHLNYDNISLINRRSIDILFISFKTILQEQHERIYSFREVELIYFSIFTNFLSAARACLTLR